MQQNKPASLEPSAIIFDLDGVVIDSIPVMEKAFAHAYREVMGGGVPPFEEYVSHCGKSFPKIMDAMGLSHNLWEPFKQKSRDLISEIRVCDGVPSLLENVQKLEKKMAILTGKDRPRTLEILRDKEIEHYFQLVLTPDDLDRAKPDPEGVFRVVEEFEVSAEAIWFLGDARSDIECALAAGCYAVYATWGALSGTGSCLAEMADLVVGRPDEIFRALPSQMPTRVVS